MGERRRHRRARAALLGAAVLVVSVPASVDPDVAHLAKVAVAAPAGSSWPALGGLALPDLTARSSTGHQPTRPPVTALASTPSTAPGEQVILPPPPTFDAAPARSAPPPSALRSASAPQRTGGTWAVIIGIDDYPGGRSDLRASVADANDVDAALAAYGVGGDRRLVLRNTQASAAVIADAARWLVDHAGPDATAVFFYAGHVRKLGEGREAIVGADGNLVTDVALADLLRPLAAWKTWIALASCYSGGFTEVLGPGRILTAAADANSLAYESSTYGNSYLVEFMVDRAMREGQAAGSVEQSYAWARDQLRAQHPQRVPVQYDQLDGELRLGPAPSASPAPSPPSPSPPPQSSPPPSNDPQPADDPPEDHDPCVLTITGVAGCDDRVTVD